MRLIDADALTEIIHGMYAEGDDPSAYHVDAEGDTLIGKFAVVDAIFNMPTIQPKRGHWIDGHSGSLVTIKCDHCNFTEVYKEKPLWKPNYCPNCGAVMNGASE